MANVIPQIAEMLGVELGEEFKVNLNGWNNIWIPNKQGLGFRYVYDTLNS